jgi:prepilin-type N-terminal cleavage/methylation domain-containing protein
MVDAGQGGAVMNDRRGFTLLELMMVVVIIGILATIAMPQYFRATERARIGQVLNLMASIRGSELRFRANSPTNVYDNSTGLVNLDIAPLPSLPPTWAAPTVTGTEANSNVSIARVGGLHDGSTLQMDLDNGTVCGSTAVANADWGLPEAITC